MRFSRMFMVFIAAAALALTGLSSPAAYAKGNPRYASIVMDADTGMIVYERYADKKLHPASLAKIMTLLMTFEAIEQGKLSLRDRVVISRHAHSMIPSKLDLAPGSSIRVEDAIYALVTKSANDVAVALAEKIGGTESGFALAMTRKAHQIGMRSTTFRNASGLHDPRQITTARDMARLGQYILRAYPQYYHYFSTRNFTYRGKTYRNHNRLMESYSGMDGFKTGYIAASGFNLVASAKRDNRRLIGVVFGGRTSNSRNAHMKKILDDGFARLENIAVARAVPVPERKPEGLTQLASIQPAAGVEDMGDWAELNPMLQNTAFRELIGEGDYDPAETKRFETGLLAIAAVKGVYAPQPAQTAALSRKKTGDWSIQVGAFESRVRTENVIRTAQQALPAALSGSNPIIVPMKTQKGWIFRGRLNGFTRDEALAACNILKDCLPVSPQAH
ncbi:MAG: D-alanyl-D-alanine carboxypeptidase [Rhodospirillales bacterium]|nr:D-alanyl-D-alanine carboxypeptidase [Rhodospirillales bacterium]MCB9997223.1 D-alanyl-D-alanine carboxypeptidase [Rhodospirillales bacterium]